MNYESVENFLMSSNFWLLLFKYFLIPIFCNSPSCQKKNHASIIISIRKYVNASNNSIAEIFDKIFELKDYSKVKFLSWFCRIDLDVKIIISNNISKISAIMYYL